MESLHIFSAPTSLTASFSFSPYILAKSSGRHTDPTFDHFLCLGRDLIVCHKTLENLELFQAYSGAPIQPWFLRVVLNDREQNPHYRKI